MYDPVYCLITAAVLSIDAFAAGVAYGVRGIRFSRLGALVFAAVCLCAVSCGVFAGSLLLFFSFGKRAGGALLTAAGLIMIMQQFSVFMRLPLFELLAAPEKTDFNKLYYDKALELADIETKKILINEVDEYREKKKQKILQWFLFLS